MQTSADLLVLALVLICSLIVVQVIEFFCDVPKELKRIANELKKMNEQKGGDE